MRNKTIKILGALIALILVFTVAMPIVNAVDLTQTTGSLTIVKYEVNSEKETAGDSTYVEDINGSGTSGFLLSGVTFAIYKIADDETSTEIPTNADILATKQELTTGTNGTVKFENLALGRYLVVEVSAPENVVSKIANFIVDIPMTNDDGDDFIYDVTVYPKNNTVYGGITLTKYGNDTTEVLEGVGFELQKLDDNGTTWSTYQTGLSTDDEGLITITGLPAGDYRFVETSTLTGYILDNNTTYEFNVSLDASGNTVVDPAAISVYNEKPEITKTITNATTDLSYTTGDTISYEITADIPSTIASLNTYTITDVIPEGLKVNYDSAEVYVADNEGTKTELTTGWEISTQDYETFELTFDNLSLLEGYKEVIVRYDTTLNSLADATSTGNTNTATLTYSTIVSTKYDGSSNTDTTSTDTATATATVYTGGFYIEKRAKTATGDLLQGAVFKLASSEAKAKAGTYMTDENGNEITLTTDENGLASYHGLAYGTYYLVEVQAPSYDDNGTTKYYNLLTSPVAITVGADTYSSDEAVTVINKTGFTLPVTGGIGATIIIIAGIALVGAGVTLYKKGENK